MIGHHHQVHVYRLLSMSRIVQPTQRGLEKLETKAEFISKRDNPI